MTYWMEDVNEKWLGDLATNFGIFELREKGSPSLNKLLDAGEADKELVAKVIDETKDIPELAYIAKMLRGAMPPVYVTDGEGREEEEEEE